MRWGRLHIGPVHVEWSLPNVPLPSVRWYWHEEHTGSVELYFGDRHSDPILAVSFPECTPPSWLEPLLDRVGRG